MAFIASFLKYLGLGEGIWLLSVKRLFLCKFPLFFLIHKIKPILKHFDGTFHWVLTYVTYLLTCWLIIYHNKKITNCWGKNFWWQSSTITYLSIRNYYVFTVGTLGILLLDLLPFQWLESKNSNAKHHILGYKFQFQTSRLTMRIPEEKNSLLALWK